MNNPEGSQGMKKAQGESTRVTGCSDCHGFVNPCGFRVGYAGVRVWVSICQPSAYPYPHGGLSNPRGTRPAGLEYYVNSMVSQAERLRSLWTSCVHFRTG